MENNGETRLNDNKEIIESTLNTKKEISTKYVMLIISLLPIFAVLISLVLGRFSIPLPELANVILSKLSGHSIAGNGTIETVLFKVRIPRIFAALLVGGSLSVAGAAYQGLFKNPMVSPDILGASAGAGFGAAIGLLLSFSSLQLQLSSFVFGLLAVALTYLISLSIGRGNNETLSLVLTGMVISTMFTAFISMIKYVADPDSKLPAITFWLMGGLSSVSINDMKILLIPVFLGILPIFLLRYQLNILSFGDEEAKSLGINTTQLRLIIILCSTLITAGSVSISGMIGWIGLIIPHAARMLVGPNYKTLLPASLFLGSTFLLIVDDVARSAFAMEIPLGILTSLIGAPFFIYLLLKGRNRWL